MPSHDKTHCYSTIALAQTVAEQPRFVKDIECVAAGVAPAVEGGVSPPGREGANFDAR
jgi:hypothetical protein